MKTAALIFTLGGSIVVYGAQARAAGGLSAGVWMNYEYQFDNPASAHEETRGDIENEALILYADGQAEDGQGRWLYSAELRIGPGSFTDTANNSSGDTFALHKAWIGWRFGQAGVLRVGKSQVPFAWKTVNFWPGDILQAGYGDQMDVGLKWTDEFGAIKYDLAYYHADDWGTTSTDSVDDNGHWGSSTTYRKVHTAVGNVEYLVAPGQRIAVSAQAGRLQDLTTGEGEVDGRHQALALWYHGEFGKFYSKLEYVLMEREMPDRHLAGARIENTRIAAELGYRHGPWFFYLDSSLAEPDTAGSTVDSVSAHAPGLSYDYGPGWIYLEYLTQDGFVDRNGQLGEGDFDALYLSIDFYL